MMLINDVGELNAFFGGFSSFFSAWQLCLMQITPFYLAFAVGFHLVQGDERVKKRIFSIFLTHAGFLIGFSFLFGSLGVSGIGFSRYIKYNIATFRLVAAVAIGLVALFIFLAGLRKKGITVGVFGLPLGLLFGLALALAYAPCITPTMSDIMNFAGQSGNAMRGFVLLSVYGVGISSALILAGLALSFVFARSFKSNFSRHLVVTATAALLLGMTALLVTGWMSTYKSFLVGLVL